MNLKEALAEIERLKVYEQAFSRAWEVKTKYDRKSKPVEIRVIVKATVVTAPHFQREVHKLLVDFNTNAVGDFG